MWNLPLFASKEVLNKRLCNVLGNVSIDFWKPKKTEHQEHGGCARIETVRDIPSGELLIGFRYPVFVKEWISNRKIERSSASIDITKKWTWEKDLEDLVSDEKTNESELSISICSALNIVENVVENCESIDICPDIEEAKKVRNVLSSEESMKNEVLVKFAYDVLRNKGTGFIQEVIEKKNWRIEVVKLMIKYHLKYNPCVWFEEKKIVAIPFNMNELNEDIKAFHEEFCTT